MESYTTGGSEDWGGRWSETRGGRDVDWGGAMLTVEYILAAIEALDDAPVGSTMFLPFEEDNATP